jgi:hypothetical protein
MRGSHPASCGHCAPADLAVRDERAELPAYRAAHARAKPPVEGGLGRVAERIENSQQEIG